MLERVFIRFLVALVEFLGKHPRGKMYARDQMSAPIAVPCLAISTMERESAKSQLTAMGIPSETVRFDPIAFALSSSGSCERDLFFLFEFLRESEFFLRVLNARLKCAMGTVALSKLGGRWCAKLKSLTNNTD